LVGGQSNNTSGAYSFIGGGLGNTSRGTYSFVGGGESNLINQFNPYSGILGGSGNTVNHNRSFIVGSNITSDRDCATFVNNLSIKNIPTSSTGLPSGSIYKDANGFLKIV
jgi:hypothetical protein